MSRFKYNVILYARLFQQERRVQSAQTAPNNGHADIHHVHELCVVSFIDKMMSFIFNYSMAMNEEASRYELKIEDGRTAHRARRRRRFENGEVPRAEVSLLGDPSESRGQASDTFLTSKRKIEG